MPLLETAIAFIIAMLGASLFVSAGVQIITRLGKYRAKGLARMMRAVLHGFRTYHNDPDAELKPEATARRKEIAVCDDKFVNDVLGDPVFFTHSEALDASSDPQDTTRLMDSVSAEDIVAIVYNWTHYYRKDPVVDAAAAPVTIDEVLAEEKPFQLPDEWVGKALDDAAREKVSIKVPPHDGADEKSYATTKNFAGYVKRWFARFELSASERYRTRVLRLTSILAAAFVLLFNFDGVQLIGQLYHHSSARAVLVGQASSVEASAQQLGADGKKEPAQNYQQLAQDMWKTASLLDDAEIGIGWQDSAIVKEWLASHEATAAAPSNHRLLLDTLKWFAGLVFSFAMISLGAPFWYKALTTALSLRGGGQDNAKTISNPPKPGPPANN